MKKNILAIAILAAVIANIILSAVVLFSVVPAANSANNMIKLICQVIDLELEDPDAQDYVQIPLSDRVPKTIGEGMTVPMQLPEGQTKQTYVQVSFSIVFNAGSEGYKDVDTLLETHAAIINNHVKSVVSSYTIAEAKANEAQIKADLLKYCRSYFGVSDLVIEVLLDILYT